MISFCNRVRELCIIKISVESRASFVAMILRKTESIKRIKEFILILWIVMTSHIKSMRHKSY